MAGRTRRAAVGAACAVAVGDVPSAALATPGSGVTGTIPVTGVSDDGLETKTKGRTDVVVRTIIVAPGGSTGWHYHPGKLIAVVQSGTLARTMADCTVSPTAFTMST